MTYQDSKLLQVRDIAIESRGIHIHGQAIRAYAAQRTEQILPSSATKHIHRPPRPNELMHTQAYDMTLTG